MIKWMMQLRQSSTKLWQHNKLKMMKKLLLKKLLLDMLT